MHECLSACVVIILLVRSCDAQTNPVLTVNNLVVTLYEDETAIQTLDTVTCTDADVPTTGPVASITYTPSTNCANCLRLEPATNPNEWDLKFYPSPATLDYATAATYFITMTCSDSTDTDQTATIEVRLTPNSYPTFDDGLAVTQTLTNPKTAYPAGTTIRTVPATDANSDAIFWSMTSSPSTTNIEIGQTTGIIATTEDLIKECNSEITLTVTITDNKATNPDNQIIVLTLTGYNQAPTISNLDATAYWPEDTASGTDLLTCAVVDDQDSEVTLTFTTTPTSAASLYTIATGFKIQSAGTFDYEDSTTQTTQVIVVADDGNCAASTYTYTVSLTDVNEAPAISPTTQTFEVYEGTISVDPAWTTTDEDSSHTTQTFTYSATFDPNTSPLVISSSTGIITTSSDYDVDGGAMTSTVTATVTVTDQGSLTSETTVVLSIKDTNDNAPVIDTGSQNVAITGTTCTLTTGSQATLTATDADSAFQDNNVFAFSLASGSSSSYISVSASGDVYLHTVPTSAVVETLVVEATDAGQYPGNLTSVVTSTIILTVTTTGCVTTTSAATTSSTTYNDFSLKDNVWWIVLSGIAALAFLVLTMYLCLTSVFPFCRRQPPGHWRMPRLSCWGHHRHPMNVQPKQPKEPKPQKAKRLTFKQAANKAHESHKPKPGNDGFWKVVQQVMNKNTDPAPATDPPPNYTAQASTIAPAKDSAPQLSDPSSRNAWQPQNQKINNLYTDDFF